MQYPCHLCSHLEIYEIREIKVLENILVKKEAKFRAARNIEWTNNSKIAYSWNQILVFQIEKILEVD